MRNLSSNIYTTIFYIAIIVCSISVIFDEFKSPWNWIISISFVLAWAIWFLFILMVVPASRNTFPPNEIDETNKNTEVHDEDTLNSSGNEIETFIRRKY